MSELAQLKKDLSRVASKKKSTVLQRFFKTGRGEYGEGDVFLGVMVPEQRKLAKKYKELSLRGIKKLLNSRSHEQRLVGLFILISHYEQAKQQNDKLIKKRLYNFYLKNSIQVNNWDLVDLSAPKIVGDFLLNKDRKVLYKLIKSKSLWERRIAVLATATFIKNNDFTDILKISRALLKDRHDLIHKATGWMLREVGKRDQEVLEKFLEQHGRQMPRTMLRYAIEKFPEPKRQSYLCNRF